MTWSLLIESKVPQVFWLEVITTATSLLNQLTTKIINLKTPIQILSELAKIPPALILSPTFFGCLVFVHMPKSDHTKFDLCAVKCVFVSYGLNQKIYR